MKDDVSGYLVNDSPRLRSRFSFINLICLFNAELLSFVSSRVWRREEVASIMPVSQTLPPSEISIMLS